MLRYPKNEDSPLTQRGPAKPHKPGGFPANNDVRTQQHTLKGSLLSIPRNIETTEEVINMAEDSYGREKAYVRSELNSGKTLSRSNPHVQTLLRASSQGVKSVQSFVETVDLESRLH